MDLEFLNQNYILQTHNYQNIKSKAFAFNKTLHFVSTKPSVPHAEASWPVLEFGVTDFIQTKTNKH